ncbi:MAG TPA: hypothetical protein VLW85_23595 [Myxococcales bacterium]|nr:hypothetical protein [Myxococcales bacterium]
MPRQSLQGLLDQFIDQFAAVIAARTQHLFKERAPKAAAGGGRKRSYPCPFPGCKNPGNGPRNRWFCAEHAKSVPVREQKRILAERAKTSGAALVVKGKKRRSSPMKGRKLDMSCRVPGCKNMSKGPRWGFMCEKHLKELSPKQQREAREKWRTAREKKAA